MNIEELREHLCERYPLLCPLFSTEYGDGVLTVDYDIVHDAAKDLLDLGFDRLGMVTAVDRGEFIEMVYRLTSREIKAGLERPAGVAVASNRVFVVDSQAQAVMLFELSGEPAGRFGRRGQCAARCHQPGGGGEHHFAAGGNQQ